MVKPKQLQKVEKKLLNIHSGAILIENKVNLLSRQAWFYLLYKAFPDLKTHDKFFVNLNELKEAIGYDSTNNKYLKQALKDLVGTPIEWNILQKDKVIWEVNSLLAGCKIEDNSSICEFAFSPFLRERLANPEMYTKLDLLVSKKFKSKHTLAIYCLALDYLQIKMNFGSKNLTLEELRKYLGLEDTEYPEVRNINQEIIKKAEKEINNDSDLNISITPIRTSNRKILGFKFEMSIKDEFVESYKAPKLVKQLENKQTNMFDGYEIKEEKIKTQSIKPKKELIKVESKELKEFFAEYKISITTNTIQDKFREAKDIFQDNFEKYLIFLMNYTKQELKRNSINSISGFFVSLFKDDVQIDNYFQELEKETKRKEVRKFEIESKLESKVKEKYNNSMSSDFEDYLEKNIDSIEDKFIEIVRNNVKKGFAYDYLIKNQNKGIIDKSLLLNYKKHIRMPLITEIKPYQEELGYRKPTFEEWKEKNITEKELAEIRIEIEKLIRS